MVDKKEAIIFSIFKNHWQRNSTISSKTDNSYQQKEHGESYQSTYGNFAERADPAQKICPEPPVESVSTRISDVVLQYCSESTVHGIRHVTPPSNKLRRFVYLVFVLVLTGFLLKFLLGILLIYAKHPYQTYYYAKVMKTLEFPTVTMCNVENTLKLPKVLVPNKTMKSALESYIPISITIDECLFNNENCYQIEPTIMLFHRKILGCYIIRPSKERFMDMESLKVTDGLVVDVLTAKVKKKGERGVRVFLHEDKTFPSQLDSSFFAGPRDATFAAIQPEKVIKLGKPYHGPDEDCRVNDSPSFVNPLKFFKYYSVTNCQRECTSLYMEEYCNCTMAYFPGTARACTFYDHEHCISKHINESLSQDTYINRCKCTPNCSHLLYDTRVSIAKMRYRNHSKEDLFRIRIYFENMVMKFLKEKPRYELDELLASFGGQMGLFLGASVISVYEFLEFVLIFAWSLLTSFFNKSRSPLRRTAAVRNNPRMMK